MSTDSIEHVTRLLSSLPGFGKRSSRRAVLFLLQNKERLMLPLAEALHRCATTVQHCINCGNLDTLSPCTICQSEKRNNGLLCVVEHVADLWAMERSHIFFGKYHVLGGTLSALDGRGPGELNIPSLVNRVAEGAIKEVILATNATVEGQTTAHYITERLKPYGILVSGLAHGIPIGGELDYLDDGTLGMALQARRAF